ncbi:MAG TPA: flagellin [Candidatus Ozemobacteraceae bacterium]|nr:flagellin [Candidatus Ozemobacteraceae bacterium]
MSLRINQNTLSLKTHSTLSQTSTRLEKSIEKLSSGLRINRAADDAAGLAISEKLRRQVRGLGRAVLNAQDGISMIQSAEGSLSETHSILQRMRELAIQSSNDTLTSNDRLEIQKEVNQLRDDINRIARNTEFNTKKLLDGSQTALISASSGSVQGMVTGVGQGSGDYDVSIALIHGGISQMQRSQIMTLKDNAGVLAQGSTQLQSIAQFYDANGIFSLGIAQTLTLTGNSKSATVVVDGQMTLDKLAASIQNALVSNSGLDIANSKVSLVNTAQTGVAELGGYFQMTSGSIGESGDVALAADQALLNALGMTTVRSSKNNLVEVTSRDMFGNLNQVRTADNNASSLLAGVDVQFSSQAAQVAGLGGLETGLTLTAQTLTISAGGTEIALTIAGGDWSMEGITRSINQQISALAVNGMSGARSVVVDGQIRILFEPTAASIASTINVTGASAAATLGLSNGTYSGFVQGSKDVTKELFGFSRFANVAATSVVFSVSDGIGIATVSFSTVSTATVADLINFASWQASQNATMKLATVQIRIDAVNGGLAFTSLRVGNENTTAGTTISQVIVNITDNANSGFINKFGMASSAAAVGDGEKNFRLHMVDNTPQFQIGADQGQNMKISIRDVSAKALNVDNLDMTTIEGAQKSLAKIGKAIDAVSAERSKLGSFQNRLEYAINNLKNTQTNLTSAESRIRDADMAQEMIEFTRNQIISQSGTAMLAQANMVPQGVLQLLS